MLTMTFSGFLRPETPHRLADLFLQVSCIPTPLSCGPSVQGQHTITEDDPSPLPPASSHVLTPAGEAIVSAQNVGDRLRRSPGTKKLDSSLLSSISVSPWLTSSQAGGATACSSEAKRTVSHRWDLPVLHYHKIMVIYPYPFLVVITQLFS